MLTYQVRKRIIQLEKETNISFPTNVLIKIEFNPLQPFGSGLDGGKTAVKATQATAEFNTHTGHYHIASETPLSPLNVVIPDEDTGKGKFVLSGNNLSISQNINSLKDLDNVIHSLYLILPMLLNVEFVDPPYIKQVSGKLGEVDFNWVLTGWGMEFQPTTQEFQEKKVVDSWRRYSILGKSSGRRLVAALHYFYVACRLGRAGNSPWEFMSEILLNYCKILEVLFPSIGESQTMSSTRQELQKLGFSSDAIEKYYIPAIVLRNSIDVAHVDLSILPGRYLKVLHSYTESAEKEFRILFQLIFSKVEANQYSIPEYEDSGPRKEVIKTVKKMEKSFASK